MEHQEASETSPLLAKPTAILPHSTPPSEIEAIGRQDGDLKSTRDEESQIIGNDRVHQYEGIPDVKAKLRYIVPAVGIGVRPSSSLHNYIFDSL